MRGIMQEPVPVPVALVQTVRFQSQEQKAVAFVRMANMLTVPIRNVKRVRQAITVQTV